MKLLLITSEYTLYLTLKSLKSVLGIDIELARSIPESVNMLENYQYSWVMCCGDTLDLRYWDLLTNKVEMLDSNFIFYTEEANSYNAQTLLGLGKLHILNKLDPAFLIRIMDLIQNDKRASA